MKKIPLGFLLLFTAWAAAIPCNLSAIGVEVAPGIAQVTPWGNLSFKGTSLDLRNDLNYSKIVTFSGRIKIDMPLLIPNVYLMAMPMKFEGISDKQTDFIFGDVIFSKNASFESSLKLDHYDAALFYSIPALETATRDKLNVEVGLNLRILDFKGELKQPKTSLSQSKSLTIPVPMGYLGVQFSPIKSLKIESELRAIAYGSNRYFDVAGKVKYVFLKFFFVAGGYKYQNIKIDQSSVNADLRFGGPLFEIGGDF